MNLFLELRESDFWYWTIESYTIPYHLRKASRALVFNDENKIALMHVTKDGYHKLPGGWLLLWESVHEALVREILEEVWADIIILDEIGMTIEYRNSAEQIQISYCYLTKVFWELHDTHMDEDEKNHWFKLLWTTIEEAIELLEKDNNNHIFAKFIKERDLRILEEAQKILNSLH